MTAPTIHPENIPEYFQKTPRWVLFKLIKHLDGSDDTKEPRCANNPQIRANINKPVSWSDFPTVIEAAKQHNMLIGFALKPDSGVLFIDVDIKKETSEDDKKVIEETKKILLSRLNTYSERSQSGAGIHIIGWYSNKLAKPKIEKIETYTGDRFCIFTGDRISKTSDVNDITDEINALAKDGVITFEKKTKNGYHPPAGTITPGGRNPELFRYTRSLKAKGIPLEDAKPRILKYNSEHCTPPHTEEYIQEHIQEWYNRPDDIETQPTGGIDLSTTDFGNARRLLNAHHGDIRYDRPNRQWVLWNEREGRWKPDTLGVAEEWAKEVIRTIQTEAKILYACVEEENDSNKKKRLKVEADRLFSWANRSQTSARITACLAIAETEISIEPAMFDNDKTLWNMTNGTYDLRTHTLLPHDRENLITKVCGYAYDPDAKCPQFERNLARCFVDRNDRAEILDYIQRAFGYCLTGDTSEQSIQMWQGRGANGKSMLLETLGIVWGDYSTTLPAQSLTTEGSRHIRNDLAILPGKRLVTSNENARGSTLDEEMIKRITGGDTVQARFLHKEWFNFSPQLKLIWSFNKAPDVRDMSNAMWRRIKRIDFQREIPESERIPMQEILQQHREESGGIFNWCLVGLKNYQTHGLKDIPSVTISVQEFKREQDTLIPFFDDCCAVYKPEEHLDEIPTPKEMKEWEAPAGELYDVYAGWAFEKGVRYPLSAPTFGKALKERGFGKFHTMIGWFYRDIKITTYFENPKYRKE